MNDFFTTKSGIKVNRSKKVISDGASIARIIKDLDSQCGAYLSSGVEFPDRYSQWDFGIISPPLSFVGVDNQLTIKALNDRGRAILAILQPTLSAPTDVSVRRFQEEELVLTISSGERFFKEEERSLQPSLFTPLRSLIQEFVGFSDSHLGLYGAFGFDLIYQFDEPVKPISRLHETTVLHLFFPDQIYIFDRRKEHAFCYEYDFLSDQDSTIGVKRDANLINVGPNSPSKKDKSIGVDISDDDYVVMVDTAREAMRQGEIFEVVLSRSFSANYDGKPSALFQAIKNVNPSPYEFFFQFGEDQLIGASPEMFVRIEGRNVESCPISGTVRRGEDPMEDAENILALLNSQKDEVELTMCTDVDRNDKSRICEPGTVRLLERRMIERYAGLFHTVDHVEGQLREGLTGLDAFLSHMWAVTLTGAPKRAAIGMVEALENVPRGWYGGAIGALALNGDVNTGITIRTVHLVDKLATYRAGATLVWDSKGADEAEETRTKAEAFFRVLQPVSYRKNTIARQHLDFSPSVLLIDNDDSFAHTLGDYLRQAGATVSTFRHGLPIERLLAESPDLVVHSPGPGRPSDFAMAELVLNLANLGLPQFGVCLGLQGIVEAFGGDLRVLDEPRHGKRWTIEHCGTGIFDNVPSPCEVGAYHSLVADRVPEVLEVTARTTSGIVMAVRHKDLPISALQFHPESILSMRYDIGHRLITNLLQQTFNVE